MPLQLREALRSARDTYRTYSNYEPESSSRSPKGQQRDAGDEPSSSRSIEASYRDSGVEIEDAGDVEVVEPPEPGPDHPDLLLDVPNLKVDEIDLEVDQLKARIALDANVLQLLQLHVGADVDLGRVKLDIRGVEAQAQLKVRLNTLAKILDRVFASVDRNPQLLARLVEQLGTDVAAVGAAADHAVGELAPHTAEAERAARSMLEQAARGNGSGNASGDGTADRDGA